MEGLARVRLGAIPIVSASVFERHGRLVGSLGGVWNESRAGNLLLGAMKKLSLGLREKLGNPSRLGHRNNAGYSEGDQGRHPADFAGDLAPASLPEMASARAPLFEFDDLVLGLVQFAGFLFPLIV